MSPRFTSNILLATLGGLLLTASLTFGVGNVGWIGLGAGAAAFAIAVVAFPGLTRGAAQRRLDAVVALLGVVTLVEARVFDDATLRWTSFGLGGAFCVLAAAGLLLHELDRERRLAALSAAAAERRPAASRNGTARTADHPGVPSTGVAA